jgi:ABC-type branched-subunit amino acid transport system substrate-binding protein
MSQDPTHQARSAARQGFPPGASCLASLAVVVVLGVASFLTVLPSFQTRPAGGSVATAQNDGPGSAGAADAGAGAAGTGPHASARPGGGAAGGAGSNAGGARAAQNTGHACAAGRNGGATDTGVTAGEIKLASTVAESGIGQSFLGEARYGMIAVLNDVNRSGGICGRQLVLSLVDDGWSPTQGQMYIRNFIAQGVFALPVVPSSEGLDAAVRGHDIDNAGIPVVGTDGMLYSQYSDPWVWPVATSTISTAHIAALTAHKAGARTFGIVYDSTYKFGTEGETAFKGAISRLPGATLKADVKVPAGNPDYSGEGKQLNDGCGTKGSVSGCDMIFVLLEPSTAETWFSTSGMRLGAMLTEGPQPLFVDTFGQNCGAPCNNMVVWTSYYPARAPFTSNPAVARYLNAVRSVSASADVDNQFLEGAYDGMLLLVQALKQVGPDLTRARLRDVLNNMTFDPGLTRPLNWHGTHFANTAMLGFSIQYSQGFNGFQYQQTDWVQDPWSTMDHP